MEINIKKIIIFHILLIWGLVAFAARYEVFKVEGDVYIIYAGKRIEAVKGIPLVGKEHIEIVRGGRIGIIDRNTNSIYYSSDKGRLTISALIGNARKRSKANTSAVGRLLVDGADKRGSKILGVVERGGNSPDSPVVESDNDNPLPDNSFGILFSRIVAGENPVTSGNTGFLLKVQADPVDSVVTYLIEAKRKNIRNLIGTACGDSITFHANVIVMHTGTVPLLVFESEDGCFMPIDGDGQWTVDWYPSKFDPEARYCLLITTGDFSVNRLQNYMKTVKTTDIPLPRPEFISDGNWRSESWLVEGM